MITKTLSVDCKRCGFECGDWYTENGYDVSRWMYYDFKDVLGLTDYFYRSLFSEAPFFFV